MDEGALLALPRCSASGLAPCSSDHVALPALELARAVECTMTISRNGGSLQAEGTFPNCERQDQALIVGSPISGEVLLKVREV